MNSSNEATQRCPQRHASPVSKYQFVERHERQYPHMVFEAEPAVKLGKENIEVGTSANGTQDKTKSPWGGFTVLDQLITKAIILLGFSSMLYS